MKVFDPYIPDDKYNFTYPDSMKKILAYLDSNGTLNVDAHIVEKLWYAFSERYDAQFLIPDDDLLKEFVDYIRNIDIEDAKNMDYYGQIHEEGYDDDFYEALSNALDD